MRLELLVYFQFVLCFGTVREKELDDFWNILFWFFIVCKLIALQIFFIEFQILHHLREIHRGAEIQGGENEERSSVAWN